MTTLTCPGCGLPYDADASADVNDFCSPECTRGLYPPYNGKGTDAEIDAAIERLLIVLRSVHAARPAKNLQRAIGLFEVPGPNVKTSIRQWQAHLCHSVARQLAGETPFRDPYVGPETAHGLAVGRVIRAFLEGTTASEADLLEAGSVGGVPAEIAMRILTKERP